jgi:hypothetical protein
MHWVKDDGNNDPSNLLPLCGYCHDQHTHGHIPEEAIRHWKGMLLALNHAFDRGSMDLLLFLWQAKDTEIWYSGDALLRFSGPIASGLVSFETKTLYGQTAASFGKLGGVNTMYHPSSFETGMVVKIGLTEKGRLLLDAWRKGDEGQYRKLIGLPENDIVPGEQSEPQRGGTT